MARLKKCVICGETIGADEKSVPYKNRYAHQRCFEVAMKTLHKDKTEQLQQKKTKQPKKTPKAELKDNVSEEEYKDKKEYYQYLRDLLQSDLNAKIYVLSEDYIKRYGFTWKSMKNTLVYLFDLLGKTLEGDAVGLIPYYHAEAVKYFESIQKIEEANKDKDVEHMYQQRVVKINPKKRKIKQLDIESIGGN